MDHRFVIITEGGDVRAVIHQPVSNLEDALTDAGYDTFTEVASVITNLRNETTTVTVRDQLDGNQSAEFTRYLHNISTDNLGTVRSIADMGCDGSFDLIRALHNSHLI